MSNAYVILLHAGWGPDHYDLMLLRGKALATWQLPQLPSNLSPGQSMPARRLADHRPAYLAHEGPVSGGRGRVARVDDGQYDLLAADDARWEVILRGRSVEGRFELCRCGPGVDDWTLRRPEQ